MANFTEERGNMALVDLEQLPKVFSDMAQAQKPKSPLTPLYQRGGTTRNCLKRPPLEKGDLGSSVRFGFCKVMMLVKRRATIHKFAHVLFAEKITSPSP
jgi:hypothetical protein